MLRFNLASVTPYHCIHTDVFPSAGRPVRAIIAAAHVLCAFKAIPDVVAMCDMCVQTSPVKKLLQAATEATRLSLVPSGHSLS
jgi:hypothetical protein